MSDLIKLLIVDDHPVVRSGLEALLTPRNGMQVVGMAADGEEAVALARKHKPDVILMDMKMPKLDGAAATKQIVAQRKATRVLILSSYDDEQALARAVLAGASGCLLKESSPDELYDAIRMVHKGQMAMPQALALRLMKVVRVVDTSAETLTPREKDVLSSVAQGLSNQQIGDLLDISDNTVRTHVSNLLHKLNYSNRTQLALYARENGLGAPTDTAQSQPDAEDTDGSPTIPEEE